MRKYQSYKPSGVEWIGEIPEGWKISKYKYNLNILSGFPFKSELFDNENGFPLLRIRDITSGTIETYYNGDFDNKYIIKKGDIVIGMDGDFNIREWDNDDILLNQRCCKIQEYNNLLLKFIYYTLPIDLTIINDLTYYTTVKHLSVDDLYNINCVLPPLQEQEEIVQFLDEKTELINRLISTKERKITLLKEQRSSLINHVVTKGLNPNVKMKDSGVEWIGEIPEGWMVSKFKYVSEIVTGNTPSKTDGGDYYSEEGFLWIKPTYLKGDKYVNDSDEKLTELGKKQTRVIPKDSIMICCIGNTIGKYGMSEQEVSTNQQINSVIPNKSKITPWYCLYFVDVFTKDLLNRSNFVTLPILTKSDLENIEIIIPTLEEQVCIVENIISKTKEIDDLVEIEQKKINLLKEYRQSLISEVVTGKIKVTTDE